MKKHLQYLWYVIKHKWYVFLECRKLGITWRGVIHDISKFLPSEWTPYVENFYGAKLENSQDIRMREEKFDMAWLLHQKRNPHHWQYWALQKDNGGIVCLRMPWQYVMEMVADWRGAGKAIHGKDDLLDWYGKNRNVMKLNDATRRLVEDMIGFEEAQPTEPIKDRGIGHG